MMRLEYHRPRSLTEARRLKQELAGSSYVAGGTDLLIRVKKRACSPRALISLRSIPELVGIEGGNPLTIGALTVMSDVQEHPLVRERHPVLVQALERLGTTQIRNAASFGGNLCNAAPCADTAPALLVLDARVRIQASTEVRELPLEEFFVGPGETAMAEDEILTAVLVDAPAPASRATFLKKGRLRADISIASVAVLLEMEGDTCRRARIAAGSVAPVPLRLKRVDAILAGHPITPELLARAQACAADEVSPITDVRASAAYRRHLVGVYVRQGIEILLARRPA